MSLTIRANMVNYIENGNLGVEKTEAEKSEAGKKQNFFAGNTMLVNDPLVEKRKEAQQKAMKVIIDAWETDKSVDKSVEDRKTHYDEMLAKKEEAQSYLKEINDKKAALMEEYGVTEDTKYKDMPEEYKQQLFELKDQADFFKNEIYDAEKFMKDDIADIKAIAIERLKSAPMVDAQKTADAIEAAANEEIIGMAIQEAKEHMDEKMEELEEQAEEKAEEKEVKEEKLEDIREIKALQEAIIEGTKEAVEKAEARQRENKAPELPIDELIELTKTNSETNKAQQVLEEIKYSMNLLEADLKGIEIDEEV